MNSAAVWGFSKFPPSALKTLQTLRRTLGKAPPCARNTGCAGLLYPDVTPRILESYPACPAQYIMDNCVYYGDYEIVGNLPVREEQEEYPVMYGQSIDARNPDNKFLSIIGMLNSIYKS